MRGSTSLVVKSKTTLGHGYSPERHLFQEVSIDLFCRRTFCLGVLLHGRREKGRGAGRWEEAGSILRLWGGQVWGLLRGKEEVIKTRLSLKTEYMVHRTNLSRNVLVV